MHRNEFFKLIASGTVSGAYLLHGSEEYVKDSAVARAIGLLEASMRSLNLAYLSEATADALITASETLPFFDARRVIVCRALPSDADAQALARYIPSIPSTTLMLFVVRGEASKKLSFVKAMEALGRDVLFSPLTEAEAARWLTQHAAEEGSLMRPESAQFMVRLVGTDCAVLEGELKKAVAYAGYGNEVTRDCISKAVTRNLDADMFEVLSLCLSGNLHEGFAMLDRLIQNGRQADDMARLLSENVSLMLEARRYIDLKLRENEIVERLDRGGRGYHIQKAARAIAPARLPRIKEAALRLLDVYRLSTNGELKARDALEQALILLA